MIGKLVALDGLTFDQIANSKIMIAFIADGCDLPQSPHHVCDIFVKNFKDT